MLKAQPAEDCAEDANLIHICHVSQRELLAEVRATVLLSITAP